MMDPVTLTLVLALSSTAGQVGPETTAVHPASRPASQPADLAIKRGEQIVAMGDSITQAGGYLRVIDAVFAQQYADLKIPRIVNAGISGEKAEDMVKRFEKDVVARKPNIVTISVGINDVWHRLEQPHDPKVLGQFRKNLDRMVHMAQQAGARVFILSPTVIQEDPASEGNRRLKLYIEAGQEVARERKAEYVNLHELFLRVVRKNRELEQKGETTAENHLTTDGVHMTPVGDTLMAVGFLRAIGVRDEKISATDLGEVFGRK